MKEQINPFTKEPLLKADDFQMLIQYCFDKTGISDETILVGCEDKSDNKNYRFVIRFVVIDEDTKDGQTVIHGTEYSFPKKQSLHTLTSSLALAIKKNIEEKNNVKDNSRKVNLRKENISNIK